MSLMRKASLAVLVVACCPWSASQAGMYFGAGFGGPCGYRPYHCGWGCGGYGWGYGGYGCGYGGFYRPYGFGVAFASPIVVGAAPVVVQQPTVVQQPVVVQPAYTPSAPSPPPSTPLPMPTPTTTTDASATPDLLPAVAVGNRRPDFATALQQLRYGDEQARADAAVSLGRMRAERAIGPIVKALNSDSSPKVREAAARGLGLIGSPTALGALQYAAQADDDREVRHSASFAAETIRGNLKRN
ncbi:MAG: HEAT repeat domain-containing protein [Gemmataceae bacterium]